jgi:hypothetical protein
MKLKKRRHDKARMIGIGLPAHITAAINHPRAGDAYSVKIDGERSRVIVLAVTRRIVKTAVIQPCEPIEFITHPRRGYTHKAHAFWDHYSGIGYGFTFHAPRRK